MKFDTSQKGMLSVFKSYKIEALKFLMGIKESGSGNVWRHLKAHSNEAVHMSRASVIFFLNDMVDDGIVEWRDATGKGGHHRIYSIIPKNEAELMTFLAEKIEAFIERELTPKPNLEIFIENEVIPEPI